MSETRFNGQEDTHRVMEIYCNNGVWGSETGEDWADDSCNPFTIYSGKKFSKAILDYINKHGIPKQGDEL